MHGLGRPICPIHGIEITSQTIEQMVDRIMELPGTNKNASSWLRLFPDRKGTHVKVFEDIKKQGYVRVRVNGEIIDLG